MPAVWQPDAATPRLRQLCTPRSSLVADRTAIKHRIHSLLHQRLIPTPSDGLFSQRGSSGWRTWSSTRTVGRRSSGICTCWMLASRFHYLFNLDDDDGEPKPIAWFLRSLEFALPLPAKPTTRLYAHCAAGVNRGPSTLYSVMRAWSRGQSWRPGAGMRPPRRPQASALPAAPAGRRHPACQSA